MAFGSNIIDAATHVFAMRRRADALRERIQIEYGGIESLRASLPRAARLWALHAGPADQSLSAQQRLYVEWVSARVQLEQAQARDTFTRNYSSHIGTWIRQRDLVRQILRPALEQQERIGPDPNPLLVVTSFSSTDLTTQYLHKPINTDPDPRIEASDCFVVSLSTVERAMRKAKMIPRYGELDDLEARPLVQGEASVVLGALTSQCIDIGVSCAMEWLPPTATFDPATVIHEAVARGYDVVPWRLPAGETATVLREVAIARLHLFPEQAVTDAVAAPLLRSIPTEDSDGLNL